MEQIDLDRAAIKSKCDDRFRHVTGSDEPAINPNFNSLAAATIFAASR